MYFAAVVLGLLVQKRQELINTRIVLLERVLIAQLHASLVRIPFQTRKILLHKAVDKLIRVLLINTVTIRIGKSRNYSPLDSDARVRPNRSLNTEILIVYLIGMVVDEQLESTRQTKRRLALGLLTNKQL